MTNPYREHADRIQTMVRDLSMEYMYQTPFEERFKNSPGYATNFVVVSGGEPFDHDFEERLTTTMKEATGKPDPEILKEATYAPNPETV